MDYDLKKDPKNLYEALKDALFLHITAPTKEQSDEALHLADIFSENLTEEDILKAKSEVDAKVDALSKENSNIDKSIKIDHYLTPGWDEELNNLEIFDVHQIKTHGGSLRVFAKKKGSSKFKIKKGFQKIKKLEKKYKINSLKTYKNLQKKAEKNKKDL